MNIDDNLKELELLTNEALINETKKLEINTNSIKNQIKNLTKEQSIIKIKLDDNEIEKCLLELRSEYIGESFEYLKSNV